MSRKKAHNLENQKKVVLKEKKEKKEKIVKKPSLVDAPEEHCFILCNGQRFKNVKELADALETLEDDVFNHHVTFDRNDFSTWIEDIFKDAQLASEIAGIKDKGQIRIVLYKHIVDKLC